MDNFISFLKSSRTFLNNIKSKGPCSKISFVLGNESCDLDSTIASLALGYFLSKKSPENLTIPLLNVSKEDFFLRSENCFVLNQARVSLDDLVFRNEVDFASIISKHTVNISLVDHHILRKSDQILAPYVRTIFDHRPVDPTHCWASENVQIRIEQVGSCCTLIADEILKHDSAMLCKSLAYLLYETIIYDTIALKPENHKATTLDIETATKLEKMFNFTEDHQMLFDRLWAAHNDVSHLTPQQLLKKDLKVVHGIFVPGLPMLVEEFLELDGVTKDMDKFMEEQEISCMLLVGLNASNNKVRRDVAIYSKTVDDKLRKSIVHALENSSENDFGFEKRDTKHGDKVHLLHVHNIKLSRKQLIPIVKTAWNNYISKNCS